MRVLRFFMVVLGVFRLSPVQSTPVDSSPKPIDSLSADSLARNPSKQHPVRSCGATVKDAAFFKPTPENWHESKAGEEYARFAASMIASPEWAGRESEPSLFALQKLGWEGFECGVSYYGCTLRPSCDDVLTKLEDKDKARWVWFVFQAMHHLTLVSSVIVVSSGHTSDRSLPS